MCWQMRIGHKVTIFPPKKRIIGPFFVTLQPANKLNTKNMDIIRDKDFGGERPLFATHDLRLENITITDGESGIKQCQNIEAYDC